MVSKLANASVLVCSILAGCTYSSAQKETITKAVDSTSTAIKSVADSISERQKVAISLRRVETIDAYLKNGNDLRNLSSADISLSFANFACTGRGELGNSRLGTDWLKTYAAGVSAITKPAPDTLSGEWARFRKLSSPAPTLKEPQAKEAGKPFSDCVAEVNGLLTLLDSPRNASVVVEAVTPQLIIEFIGLAKGLVDSVGEFAKDGLRNLNEIQARKRAGEFIDKHRERSKRVVDDYVRPAKLDESWQRQKAQTLREPLTSLKELFDMKAAGRADQQIRSKAKEIQNQLSAFDSMNGTLPPSTLVEDLSAAMEHLAQAVKDDSVSLDAIVEFAEGYAKSAEELRSDYEAIQKKWEELVKKIQ